VYNLPLPLRRYYAELLVKTKEEENKQYDKAMSQNQDPRLMKN
tara:strand:- start:133 stop:261 length:129 start_codon:yes stop_codon:yes gene_type:complete